MINVRSYNFDFRVSELLDYTAEEMTGMSLYALCHGEDVHKLKNTHEDCKFFTFFLKNEPTIN